MTPTDLVAITTVESVREFLQIFSAVRMHYAAFSGAAKGPTRRHDMHIDRDGVNVCVVCDGAAQRFSCSRESLKIERERNVIATPP